MLTKSAKQKGRRAAQEVVDLLRRRLPVEQDDVAVTPSSVPGEDVTLSPKARSLFPYAVEVKNRESINVWQSFDQAKKYERSGLKALLFFRRNKSELMVCMRAEDFMEALCRRN